MIDVCAAPGGKALHVAEKLRGTGSVEARDLSLYKVGLITENIERSGLTNIHAVQKDATVCDADVKDAADLVIADLPCSGLGVLAKKTDLKYKATEQSTKELAGLQREILKNAASYVRSGGTLIYSTCTINPAENIENVHWFLREFPEILMDPIAQNCVALFRIVWKKQDVCSCFREFIKVTAFLLPDSERNKRIEKG